jgi:hypothetical protein
MMPLGIPRPSTLPTTTVMVYKDKNEAAIRWQTPPKFYSKTEVRILTIIQQAHCVINNKDRKLAYKVGYLEEALKSIEESITKVENY